MGDEVLVSPAAPVEVNIGASKTRIPGFVNVDVVPWADISIDLNRDPLPFDDDCVDLIFCYHTLEHVDDLVAVLSEMHRVLRHGGRLLVGVPYVSLTEYNLVNPYHKQNFNEYTFDFFDPGKLLGSASEHTPIRFEKIYHQFHYLPRFGRLPRFLRTWCRRHLFNVVQRIDFGIRAIKTASALPDVTPELQRSWRAEFKRCLRARVPYDQPVERA
ncbi:MAG: class I SAM-dependent methyltransferase [Planctomycetota bacterium]|jgi:SAM-dependent methyltransferase